jgi:hypothetical protein
MDKLKMIGQKFDFFGHLLGPGQVCYWQAVSNPAAWV